MFWSHFQFLQLIEGTVVWVMCNLYSAELKLKFGKQTPLSGLDIKIGSLF